MRRIGVLLGFAGLLGGAAIAQTAMTSAPPYWAWPIAKPAAGPAPKPDNTVKKSLPGSKARFTEAGVNDRFNIPDWYPGDHPALPEVVAHGRKPNVFACGFCHLPNGQGRPENASLAGQPADYIVEQVMEMKAGRRKTSQMMGSIKSMYAIANAVTPQEARIAADYFSRLRYKKWIRVVETDTVPKTDISSHNMLVKAPGNAREPIGNRIIEIPQNLDRTELRDSRSGFIAYVPRGSVERGRKLVQSGAGAFPCASCHGAHLKGDGNVPGLAGRSPSGIVRQLYDFKHGTRTGPAADPMKTETANMTDAQRLDIAAYLASLNP